MIAVCSSAADLTFVTWVPASPRGDTRAGVCRAYEEILARLNGSPILQERIYGDLELAPQVLAARADGLGVRGGDHPVPPTFVEGSPLAGPGLAGIHIIAARPDTSRVPELLSWNGVSCGRIVHGAEASYLMLSDLAQALVDGTDTAPAVEAERTLEMAAALLSSACWSFRDVVRIWFYLDDILGWYGDFNRARTACFRCLELDGDSPTLPASTGVHGRNVRGAPCTLDLLAVKRRAGSRLDVHRLRSVRQNEAPEYGSAFSRGLAVTTDHARYLFVSGTAAIDESGSSIHAGHFERQVERTVENVRDLIASAGADLGNVCQGTAFVKRAADAAALRPILQRLGLAEVPVVMMVGDICRDELLFELDATAVQVPPPSPPRSG